MPEEVAGALSLSAGRYGELEADGREQLGHEIVEPVKGGIGARAVEDCMHIVFWRFECQLIGTMMYLDHTGTDCVNLLLPGRCSCSWSLWLSGCLAK